jgi:hypothetical protein
LLAVDRRHVHEVLVDQPLPVLGDAHRAGAGEVEAPPPAGRREPLAAGLYGVAGEVRCAVREEGGEPGAWSSGLQVPRRLLELGPRPRHRDPVLLEQVPAVEQDLRLDVDRHGVDVPVERDLVPRLGQQLRAEPVVDAVGQVQERPVDREGGERDVVRGGDVGGVARSRRVGELGVGPRRARRRHVEVHLDVGVGGVEGVDDRLRAPQGRPERDHGGAAARVVGPGAGTRGEHGRCGEGATERSDSVGHGRTPRRRESAFPATVKHGSILVKTVRSK